MKIIICGAGLVGMGIARQLIQEENDVIIIDHNPENIRNVNRKSRLLCLFGFFLHIPMS